MPRSRSFSPTGSRSADVNRARCDAVVISPGPGRPENAGISVPLVRERAALLPMLGVCLGHQAIVCAFGGTIERARELVHGKTSPVRHDGRGVFAGLENPFDATRYHSLAVARRAFPTRSKRAPTRRMGPSSA